MYWVLMVHQYVAHSPVGEAYIHNNYLHITLIINHLSYILPAEFLSKLKSLKCFDFE